MQIVVFLTALLASAVFTQPLWQASKKFGKRKLELTLIRALHVTKKPVGFSAFAAAVVEAAEDGEVSSFLERAFSERGLLPKRP